MAVFDFRPAFSKTANPEVKQLQDAIQTMAQKLSIVLRDIDEDNLAPELRAKIDPDSSKE